MSRNFKIMSTLWHYEWVGLRRQRVVIVLLSFFTLLGLYAINNGRSMVARQLLVVDSLQKIQETNFRTLIGRYKADTSTVLGKTFAKQAGIPQVVEFINPPYAINPPTALAVLAMGQRNMLPFFDLVNTKRTNLTTPAMEIANPEKLASGNFDLVFVFIYLIPLLTIAWCHNILSQEKEQQTDRLLQVYGTDIRVVIIGKLAFRFLILCSLIATISLIGFACSPLRNSIKLTDTCLWLLATFVYLVFWFIVSWLIVQLNMSSRNSALSLIGIWLLLAVLLPAVLTKAADVAYPLPVTADLDAHARTVTNETWEMPIPILIDSFYNYNPKYRHLRQSTDTAQYGNKRFAAYEDLLQRRLNRLADGYYQQASSNYKLTAKLNGFDPVTAIEHFLNADAETNRSDYTRFEKHVNRFQQQYTLFMNFYLLNERQIQLKELNELPQFDQTADDTKTTRLLRALFPLTFILLAATLTGVTMKINTD